jgi:hypothetical protein
LDCALHFRLQLLLMRLAPNGAADQLPGSNVWSRPGSAHWIGATAPYVGTLLGISRGPRSGPPTEC